LQQPETEKGESTMPTTNPNSGPGEQRTNPERDPATGEPDETTREGGREPARENANPNQPQQGQPTQPGQTSQATGAGPQQPRQPTDHQGEPKPKARSLRGFAAMDAERQRAIASKGGQSQGKANNPGNFANDRQKAREAGRKGGQA
jgi:general stress protein YciG